ncbi:Pex24p-domain-containing protein [Daldinia caldariorum]|uniref:Pex24p-domain-containing protein n=1 Tax=Daldinia caldariorum TaxID=326644 RepID=UPI002007976F|nr:Pex24p-domain-containing protein [Daldinia caldariorum]KAI1467975.1 Pex24p-domain-containing protein [Daldinia caldariorum]
MDEDGSDVFANRDEPVPSIILEGSSPPRPLTPSISGDHSDGETPSRRKGLRGRFSAFKEKTKIQDQLVEKLLSQVVPLDDAQIPQDDAAQEPSTPGAARPNFNLTTMSNNFRRFNARIGVVFVFQARVLRLLSWRKPTHTISFLAVFTFVCLDPYLLPILPLTALLIGVLIPSFIARHPAAEFSLSSEQAIGYSPHGPPLAPARTVKPAKELSRDFFRNMRDLQNSMEDFSQLHDNIIALVVPRTNFSDEAMSSALFVSVSVVCIFMSIASNILPWRFIFLSIGWVITCSGHPAIQRQLRTAHEKHIHPQEEKARGLIEQWIEQDVILDSAPEVREVEIFELQRLSSAGEWEPWLFSASPYDPLSPQRIAGDRPVGTRFFEDVLPPKGWEWSEKKWALDLWSREWVEERIITGVEVETEGERWVYDIYDEQAAEKVGVIEHPTPLKGKEKAKIPQKPSWEEGEDSDGRRGEWRRRRWVRLVKRKILAGTHT